MGATIRILGLDPGLARMGWGVIDMTGTRLTHVAHGVLTSNAKAELAARLMVLHELLCAVIAEHRPAAISVEQAFVAKDPSAALKLGHARAIALLAAAQAGLMSRNTRPTTSRNASSASAMPARTRSA
jgi:crossover junction endodeoxyribonuclease RuvC